MADEAPLPPPDRKRSVDLSTIKNKAKRSEVFQRQREQKRKDQRQERRIRKREREELGDAAPAPKQQRTLDNTREFDETVVTADDEEVQRDEATDEFAAYFTGQTPKVMITTSRKPVGEVFTFIQELLSVIPESHFHRRKTYDIKEVVQFAKNETFTDLILVNEYRKKPQSLTIVHLPDGPTSHYKLTSIRTTDQISLDKRTQHHGRSTSHTPEIILNNFTTRLGHTIGRQLAALFPQQPEFTGRQAVTFHNQRDFIFFRRHRYIFKDGKRANLQELGPQFCLKLQWLQKGTFDVKFGDYEWQHKPELDTSRRRFFL